MFNQDKKGTNERLFRLGENLNQDHWVNRMNSVLKAASTKFVIEKDQEAKDAVKAAVKELEDNGVIADLTESAKYGQFGVLHAMFYCFTEPISKLTNTKVKLALKTL